jgi:hypothetical protein
MLALIERCGRLQRSPGTTSLGGIEDMSMKWGAQPDAGAQRRRRVAIVAAAAIGVCVSEAAFAAVDPPQPERVWAGCVLSAATVAAIQADVLSGIGLNLPQPVADDIQVAFVFVYSLQDNDGQGPVKTGSVTGFTGPVLCSNPAEVATPIKVKETDDIPGPNGPAGATSVDILDLEEAMILRYKVNGGSANGKIEKRVCHTTGNNNDCHRIPAQ